MMDGKILIVDDSKVDQAIIHNILSGFDLLSAEDGLAALEVLDQVDDISIIILDLNMPRMNGFEVLERLKSTYSHLELAVLILTNYEEVENEIKGLELGAVDYIRKPLNSESLLKRIQVHLKLLQAKKAIKIHNEQLEELVRARTQELVMARDTTINALINLLEVRDIESSNHTKRTLLMMKALCQRLSQKPAYKDKLTDTCIEMLYKTAPLHDIGKVGIPDNILLKPGLLTEDEYAIMKNHVAFGVDAMDLSPTDHKSGGFMSTALKVIGAHHEKYDGSGYPKGLKGKEIPLEGRLMAVVDVYDALSSERVYKDAFDHDYSMNILIEEKGKHFDPDIVDAFIEIQEEIKEIAFRYRSTKAGDKVEK